MSSQSRLVAGNLLILLPTVEFGGASILSLLLGGDQGYAQNKLRQDFWRARPRPRGCVAGAIFGGL
jgi:hypothetical protein